MLVPHRIEEALMSTTLATRTTTWSAVERLVRFPWLAVIGACAAVVALTTWLVVSLSSTNHAGTTTHRPVTHVQQVGGTNQQSQLCVPAANAPYC
jgi:negative regulator of sigma E activity